MIDFVRKIVVMLKENEIKTIKMTHGSVPRMIV
jgi:hypothetical protein